MKGNRVRDPSIFSINSAGDYVPWIGMLTVMLTAAGFEYSQGHVWWCKVGDLVPWSWNIWTMHASQHLIDPYSFTHILHGVLEFWLIGLIFGRVPVVWRLLVAVMIEGSWEIIENSSYVINRYREVTISLGYYGDSIINSMSDIICCAMGFVVAYKLKFWKSLALFVATETVLIFWIHDSLLLNLIMLIRPIEAIKNWQMSGMN